MERTTQPSRLEAVDDVVLLASPDAVDAIRAFYRDIAGLPEVPPVDGDAMCFRCERVSLKVRLADRPPVNANVRRATIVVANLDELTQRLDQHRIAIEVQSGVAWTARRIYAEDPAGYRIEFKQVWPF